LYQGGGKPPKKPNKSDKAPENQKPKKITDNQLKRLANNAKKAIRTSRVRPSKVDKPEPEEHLPIQDQDSTVNQQVSTATNRFANHENRIRIEGHGLAMIEVNQVKSNPTEYIYANQVQALIRLFAMNSARRIAVVSTIYTGLMQQRHFATFRDYNPLNIDFSSNSEQPYYFDDNHDLANEISDVIIPVVLNQHFAVAFYEPGDSTILVIIVHIISIHLIGLCKMRYDKH
jgi:hypothetical protein